uniref:AlNc14C407G11420 protein n=1 Tax=Albugo laibachii Nc14 TaxID=890382 RepID=F0WZ11_9STRA|nr:AlNc14C407G11420 [Albugo laibachii Nc14]|eukprot:CCA26726.1 AlNc14C407G11420 [Albugo laibachii Nc14]
MTVEALNPFKQGFEATGQVRAHLTCDKQIWSLLDLVKTTYYNTPSFPYPE